MTDREIICAQMEPKPEVPVPPFPFWQGKFSNCGWWQLASSGGGAILEWRPRVLDLNALRAVEYRLTAEQWRAYESISVGWWSDGPKIISGFRAAVHASAEQKILALSQVFRHPE